MSKLNRKEKKELLKLGVDKFLEVHGYDPRAKSALLQSYNKLVLKKTAKQVLIVAHGLPPLLTAAISLLPDPPGELDDECKQHIKSLFCSVIDCLYGKQVRICHDQQSAPGG